MKKEFGKSVFLYTGDRAQGHIIQRMKRQFDPGWKSDNPNWKEIDLYDFVMKTAKGESFITTVERSNFTINDITEESYAQAEAKQEIGERYSIADFKNPIVKTFLSHYVYNQDSAEPNDIFLQVEGDRAYGFHLLNVHTADVDVNMGTNPSENHLMIRYNENIHGGWKERMDYITQIFEGMGFDVNNKEGYLHMNHPNPGNKNRMNPILQEAIRGLVSTTHLNLTFRYAPNHVNQAVDAFKNGKTNIYDFLESNSEVIELKKQEEIMRAQYFKQKERRF